MASRRATRTPHAPQSLHAEAHDAYCLFQDLCQLTNGDAYVCARERRTHAHAQLTIACAACNNRPSFLEGMTEMSRSFGLELIEAVLSSHSEVFLQVLQRRLPCADRRGALIIARRVARIDRSAHGNRFGRWPICNIVPCCSRRMSLVYARPISRCDPAHRSCRNSVSC